MKTTHFPLLMAALFLMSTSSCKKDDETEMATDPMATKIQWIWRVENIVVSDNLNGVERYSTYDGLPTDYVEFRGDGKMYTEYQGKRDTSDYKIIDHQRISIDGDNAIIRELTDSSLVLFDKENVVNIGYVAISYNLKR